MISSFGFFMLLAFMGAYLVFVSEYRRKEAEGVIHPFYRKVRPVPGVLIILGGMIIGAKLFYWWWHRGVYIGTPVDFIFSFRGDLAGLIIGGVLGFWQVQRRQRKIAEGEEKPVEKELTHPYQLMDMLLLYCGLFGFAGSILFAKFEAPFPWKGLFIYNGINFYGALIAGSLTYLVINKRYGIGLANAADIGSCGMMLAYAIGRMGCHVAGDGDWGIVNTQPLPRWLGWLPDWLWAYRYPHNSIHQGVYMPGCTGNNCTILLQPVFPTPLYESVICLCLFFFLWSIRRKIKTPGVLFAIYAILNGAERFSIEFIRVNPRFSIGSRELSQAQLLALGWIAVGVGTWIWQQRRPSNN